MAKSSSQGTESDPRFPSGAWRGFWLQGSVKGPMDLSLTFAGGKVQGEGDDPVGRFIMRGTYELESGRIILHKSYIDAHEVLYEGWAETQHGIWGLWRIIILRGGFQIWPVGRGESQKKRTEVAEPVGVA